MSWVGLFLAMATAGGTPVEEPKEPEPRDDKDPFYLPMDLDTGWPCPRCGKPTWERYCSNGHAKARVRPKEKI